MTTLAYAEVSAVIHRMKREHGLTEILAQSAFEVLDHGPWHRIAISPSWPHIRKLARPHALRGADLWHLAAAMTLKCEIPEIRLLTFDERLRSAPREAGIPFA